MQVPYSEISLTPEQFDIFTEIIKTIRVQILNNQSGKIAFEDVIELNWNSHGVRVEIIANKT